MQSLVESSKGFKKGGQGRSPSKNSPSKNKSRVPAKKGGAGNEKEQQGGRGWGSFLVELFKENLEADVIALLSQANSPVAVACSGGPDSIAAALIAQALCPEPITLLHFNHKLRGRKSDGDAKFVREFAQKMQMGFRLSEWEAPDKKNETAARAARLKFLHQWEHELIVFGHHADDAVETLLMRLARGATLEGLCAPHAVNKMRNHWHARPLINLRKKEIVDALKKLKIKYRKDASNAGSDYLRNRIRNKLLPLWQRIETRDVAAGILKAREHLKKLLQGNLNTSQTFEEDFLEDKKFHQKTDFSINLPIGSMIFLPFGASISAQRVAAPSLEQMKTESGPCSRVWIGDRAAALHISPWQPGERYRPMGAGSRKIKEILNENCGEFSSDLRACWPVFRDAKGLPLWLPGARVTQNAAVKPNDAHAIELKFSPPRGNLGEDPQKSPNVY